MCTVKNLIIMVVEQNDNELEKTCTSLRSLGVETIICVHDYKEAMVIIEQDPNIDLVIADLTDEDLRPTGVFLCGVAKRVRPEILFLISSKKSGVTFVGQSLSAGADGTLSKNHLNEIEGKLPIWLDLLIKRKNFNELLEK